MWESKRKLRNGGCGFLLPPSHKNKSYDTEDYGDNFPLGDLKSVISP
jgi:hypothetical protein